MENKHITIHDFDFTVVADFLKDLDRQEPGDRTITETALKFIIHLPTTNLKIRRI